MRCARHAAGTRVRDPALAGGAQAQRRLAAIAQAPLFRGASERERCDIAAWARECAAARRQVFVAQGQPAEESLLLCAGRVKITQVSADGQEFIVRLVGPGEHFGGLGLPPGDVHPATAEALEPSIALQWNRRQLDEIIEGSPVLHGNALRIVAQRLRSAEERCREMATERVAQRVAHTLFRLLGHIGRPADGAVYVSLTREELAQMSGTTLFTVSRLFSQWEAEGLIRPRREGVLIDDSAGLVRVAEACVVERHGTAG